LQHRGALTDAQVRQQHHLAARKFQRVMVLVGLSRLICLNRATFSCSFLLGKKSESVITPDVVVDDMPHG
jgi:hypothetical protein